MNLLLLKDPTHMRTFKKYAFVTTSAVFTSVCASAAVAKAAAGDLFESAVAGTLCAAGGVATYVALVPENENATDGLDRHELSAERKAAIDAYVDDCVENNKELYPEHPITGQPVMEVAK